MSLRAAFLLTLLLLPLVSLAAAQTPEFTVMSVERVGDDVTVELRANRDIKNLTVGMYVGDTIVALPEQEHETWPAGQTRSGTFSLLKQVDSATLRLVWEYVPSAYITRNIDIYVPPPRSAESPLAPRVVVSDAVLDGPSLRMEIVNVGGSATGQVLVSIEDSDGRKIATPFYRTVQSLAPSAEASATFVVPEGARDLVAALEYSNRTEKTRLAVRAAQGGDGAEQGPPTNVTLATELPFREVDIGRTVDFAVTVRNGGRLALVRLDVDDLPAGYSARFFVGGSAVPSLYLDRNQSRQVTLSLTVPNAEGEVDRTVDFSVVANVNGTNVATLPMGLAVRGVGRLAVESSEAFPPLAPGGVARTSITVSNTGSAPLFNVEMDSRRPYGWTVRYEPARIERLDPGESLQVSVEVRAPDVISTGQYSTDVSARSGEVSSRWTTLSLKVEADAGGGGGWLWLLFVGTISGTLGWGAWRKWRG